MKLVVVAILLANIISGCARKEVSVPVSSEPANALPNLVLQALTPEAQQTARRNTPEAINARASFEKARAQADNCIQNALPLFAMSDSRDDIAAGLAFDSCHNHVWLYYMNLSIGGGSTFSHSELEASVQREKSRELPALTLKISSLRVRAPN